jgi:thioredoxin 1
MKVIAIDNSNFDVEVLQASLPVLVDFYADWCGPCKMVGPMIERLANEYDGKFKFCKVNVDDAQDLQ